MSLPTKTSPEKDEQEASSSPTGSPPPPPYSQIFNYGTVLATATDLSTLYDLKGIPDAHVLHFEQAPPLEQPSSARATTDTEGDIQTFDPIVQYNPEELYRFFMTHTSKPIVNVRVRGYHQEHRTRVVHHNGQSRTEHYTVDVTDFSMAISLTHYIRDQWTRIVSIPREGASNQTIQQDIQEYCESRNKLKEISLKKQLLWNFGEINRVISTIIRNAGYMANVSITFDSTNDKVTAYSDSILSKMAHDTCLNVLCVLTCLCVIFWPIIALTKHKMSNKLVAEYAMTITEPQFYSIYYWPIIGVVQHRVQNAML